MVIYQKEIGSFIEDCANPSIIANNVMDNLRLNGCYLGEDHGDALYRSFYNSLPMMSKVLDCELFSKSINIAIEYKLRNSNRRIDFIVYGKDENDHDNVVIIELKQWSTVRTSKLEDHVITNGGHGEDDYWHPSYQAYNYASTMYNFNEYIRKEHVKLTTCSYLHNLDEFYDFVIENINNFPLLKDAPAFLKDDTKKLRDFISKYVSKPNSRLLYYIDNSNVSPSKELANILSKSIKGCDFFSYDDGQAKSVATIVSQVKETIDSNSRATIIIKGGPGTGKSVVAINVLGKLLNEKVNDRRINAAYFTTNSAPKEYFKKLLKADNYTNNAIKDLFKSPVCLKDACQFDFDCVLVDEAHRVYDWKGGTGVKKGVSLLEKLITSSHVSVFFIDEDQAVTAFDFATIDRIEQVAKANDSTFIKNPTLELTSQYRCLGGDDYISFVKGFLEYDGYVPHKYNGQKYDLKVFDKAIDMKNAIEQKNNLHHKCRLLAGYTYNWKSKKNPQAMDIVLDDGEFQMQWNLNKNNYSFLFDDDSISQVGCIHTSQGLDMEYVGVIIGKDLIYRDGHLSFDKTKNAKTDNSSKIRTSDDELAKKLIRNTYNVLLTRGIRGTYIYCEDEGLREYLKGLIKSNDISNID